MANTRASRGWFARTGWYATAAAMFVTSTVSALAAQGEAPKIGTGIYSSIQAERGKQVFQSTCTTCHNFDLTGNAARGPALVGESFIANWESETLNALFTKLKNTMPRNNPGSLTEEVYLDLLAYILQANTFPAGGEALKAETLDGIAVVRKGGAEGVPNFAMVEMVGCLVRSDDAWVLTNTSAPVATKDQQLSPDELKGAAATPLGIDSFRLMSVNGFGPESHKGHKVQAKGLLYRAPSDNRLNVTSLGTVDSSCPR
jgi:mono/diheme cytochrome c family protein